MNQKNESAIFDLEQIDSGLPMARLVFLSTVDSTNDWVRRNKAGNWLRPPVVVLTDRQTAGRGRGARRWASGPGSLTFSYVIDHARSPADPGATLLLPLAAGLSIANTVDQLSGQACLIKWPNDVIFHEKKVAGVLVETVSNASIGNCTMVGIGVNLSTEIDAKALPLAGSISDLMNMASSQDDDCSQLSPTSFLIQLIKNLDGLVKRLSTDPASVVRECNAVSWLCGKQVKIKNGANEILGTVRQIENSGGLKIETESGSELLFSGHITLA